MVWGAILARMLGPEIVMAYLAIPLRWNKKREFVVAVKTVVFKCPMGIMMAHSGTCPMTPPAVWFRKITVGLIHYAYILWNIIHDWVGWSVDFALDKSWSRKGNGCHT
jgi:hypothetical protein